VSARQELRKIVTMSSPRREQWQHSANFRFYAELNDFLPPARRGRSFAHRFNGTPSVKDTVEAIGVPHTEIDLILVNGVSVGFGHLLRGDERVAVFPMFERFDITSETRLRPRPLREPRFLLDVHLGKLARYLRLLGFDAAYANDIEDAEIVTRAAAERRIILTRDVGLLKRSEVTHGYWVRSSNPTEQLSELADALDLRSGLKPFSRCMVCNGVLDTFEEREVRDALSPGVRGRYATVARCRDCARLYWPGSHYDRLTRMVHEFARG
jgi:uncharacterized protein with PIN domain